jgi:hypothetical protein
MRDAGSFWARRRAAVRAEAEAEVRAAEETEARARAKALADKDDADVLAELGLPDPSEMRQGDDFSAFMASEVPARLRKQALRTLWRSNPVLACVDGLNDYDDDYRAAALMTEPVKTAYQVGRGMMKHIEEMARQAQAQDEPLEIAGEEAAPLTTAADDQAEPATLAYSNESTAQRDTASAESFETEAAPAPRRMRFRFEETAL